VSLLNLEENVSGVETRWIAMGSTALPRSPAKILTPPSLGRGSEILNPESEVVALLLL